MININTMDIYIFVLINKTFETIHDKERVWNICHSILMLAVMP